MRAENEGFVVGDGWIGFLPGGGFELIAFPSSLKLSEAFFFRFEEFPDQMERCGGIRRFRIALSDEDLAGGDVRDAGKVVADAAADGGVEVGVQEEQRVVFSVVNEAASTSEEADVEATDGLIESAGFLIGPMDDADLVVVNGGSEIEGVAAMIGKAGELFCGEFPSGRLGYGRRWQREIWQSGGGTALEGEGGAGCAGNGDGGVDTDDGQRLALNRGGWGECRDLKTGRDVGAGGNLRIRRRG